MLCFPSIKGCRVADIYCKQQSNINDQCVFDIHRGISIRTLSQRAMDNVNKAESGNRENTTTWKEIKTKYQCEFVGLFVH